MNQVSHVTWKNVLFVSYFMMATIPYRLYRKPPDIIVSMNNVCFMMQQRRHWLTLSTITLSLFLMTIILPASTAYTSFNVVAPNVNKNKEATLVSNMISDCMHSHERQFNAHVTETITNSRPRQVPNWDEESTSILIDTGATRTLTPHLSDLIDAKPYHATVRGVGSGKITHTGKIRWSVRDENGKCVYIEDATAFCAPGLPYRLLCPHSWRDHQDDKRHAKGELEGDQANLAMANDGSGYYLTWNRGKINVKAPLDEATNLPLIQVKGHFTYYSAFHAQFKTFSTCLPDMNTINTSDKSEYQEQSDLEDPTPFNLNGTSKLSAEAKVLPRQPSVQNYSTQTHREKTSTLNEPLTRRDVAEFLQWHVRCNHAPFKLIRWASRIGILPRKLSKVENVMCSACMYGKQKRKPWRTKGSHSSTIRKATKPGECVSVDQLITKTPGLVPQTTGRLTKARYTVATIFVDHASDLDYVYLQESTNAMETIEAKQEFERFCQQHGVRVKHYHADNGIFASRAFREEVQRCGQTLSFCAVGAHHQNGVAERRIQDLSETARSSLAYAAHRNPAVTDHLWPFALRHASYTRRLLPRSGKIQSPLEIFSASTVRPNLKNLHPFGAPTYVLQESLQSGNSQPKWNERSRVGVYLGHSRQHASNVSLILNPKTGYVSPQFHCIFDDAFETPNQDTNFNKIWAAKAGLLHFSEGESEDYSSTLIPPSMHAPFHQQPDEVPFDPPPVDPVDDDVYDAAANEPSSINNDNPIEPVEPAPSSVNPVPLQNEGDLFQQSNDVTSAAPHEIQRQPVVTRSGRQVTRSKKLLESEMLHTLKSFAAGSFCLFMAMTDIDLELLDQAINAFPASLADNDTMYLKQALQQVDRAKFLEAMIKEIADHTKRGHWRITTRDEMRAKGYYHRPIMAVWSFKRKRNPVGEITKYKARLCCHGGQTIKGVHYQDTYSPVVSWTTVRILMILSLVNNWHARQIDFVLAFPQAKVRTDIYMHIPDRFEVKKGKLVLNEKALPPSKQREVVKLIKNVYGLSDASLTWHLHIKKGLLQCGFKQSQVDPCLFMKDSILFILYVDDAICLCPKKQQADIIIKKLMKMGYILTDEGSMSAYLGLQVEKLDEMTISIKQPAFIERILKQMNLKDARLHDTPADCVLRRDENGNPRKNEFHYRSIIGQLNYLAATTRPDILFAVHQCARFCQDPKMSHEKAVKRIIRYLKKTKNEGLIMKVDRTKGVECFVDADFAGGYSKHYEVNQKDCLSRTGYVVKYGGCPIIFSSKLQSTISLSTTEAEYVALSSAMREVIFVINLLSEMKKSGIPLIHKTPEVICNVYEDNVGALELAKTPKLRPRTKHLAIQLHHFRSWTVRGINDEPPRIKIRHIRTELQQADIFTKPLPRPAFLALRKLLCGW